MWESYLERQDHWPEEVAPKDLYSYFVSKQLLKSPNGTILIWGRMSFLYLLHGNQTFKEFWEQVRETNPEKSDYFESLNEKQMGDESGWIEDEYLKFLYKKQFNEMLEAERKELHTEFYKIRPRAYQAALKGEAIRLSCKVDEVRPLSLLLPLAPNGKEESRLVDLPDAVFLSIVSRLDTLDIFRVTLVCKRWKNVIYNNPRDLKRVEHAKTTDLITFTTWMDPKRTQSCRRFNRDYRRFSQGLIRWCCGISENLETVILDHPITNVYAVALIQSCPNLKNLQIGCSRTFHCLDRNTPFNLDVVPSKLEFYCSQMYNLADGLDLNLKILFSCESLLYFGADLRLNSTPPLAIRDRMKHTFGNLVALDLANISFSLLEILANFDRLHLKYLGLGNFASFWLFGDEEEKEEVIRLGGLLDRILPKLMTLELLKVGAPGIGSSTIKLLTELKLNLKFVAIQESNTRRRRNSFNDPNERYCFDGEELTDFGQMLLSNDPGLDLSEFFFFLNVQRGKQYFTGLNLGFTFFDESDDEKIDSCDVRLDFQSIKRQLGIDF